MFSHVKCVGNMQLTYTMDFLQKGLIRLSLNSGVSFALESAPMGFETITYSKTYSEGLTL